MAGSADRRASLQAADDFSRAEFRRMDGDLNSLRSQFREFMKTSLSSKEVRELRAGIHQMKEGMVRTEAVAKQSEQQRVVLEDVQRQQQQTRQILESLPNKKQLKALANFVDKGFHTGELQQAQMQKQVEGMFENIWTSVQRELTEMKDVLERSKQILAQVEQRELSTERSSRDIQGELDPIKRDVLSITQDANKMRQQNEDMRRSLEEANKEAKQNEAMRRSLEEATKEAKRIANEMRSMSREAAGASGAKGLGKEALSQLSEIETKTKGMDAMGKLTVQVESTQQYYFALKQKLYDAGVLVPPKPVEMDAVPVGTVELGEDIFSARLLIRLGLLKCRSEQIEEHLKQKAAAPKRQGSYSQLTLMDVGDDDEEDTMDYDESSIVDWEENVTGLVLPDLEPGSDGWCAVNQGMLWICLTTSSTQVFIVGLLIYYGITTGSCLDPMHPISAIDWFILHFSKAVATVSVGFFMGKDLMELANYLMTSILLESHLRPDVLLMAFLRVTTAVSVGIANLVMFIGLTSPFEVWINMTALGFVSEMGSHMLDVAKRGFFGHHISKVTCETNFSLNFMTEYPRWFGIAQFITVALGISFSVFFGIFLFFAPDIYSTAEGFCPIEKQGIFAYFNTTHHHYENFVKPVVISGTIAETGEGSVAHHHSHAH